MGQGVNVIYVMFYNNVMFVYIVQTRAKFVNKLILSLKNILTIWRNTLDLPAATFQSAYVCVCIKFPVCINL